MEDDNDDADTEDEDARTEASDCMSDVTEADGEVPKTVFDDIWAEGKSRCPRAKDDLRNLRYGSGTCHWAPV